MSLTELKSETMQVWNQLQAKLTAIEAEQKRQGEVLVSQGGSVPAEYKTQIDKMNADIDRIMEHIKEQELAGKRRIVHGYDSQEIKSDHHKAFMKAIRHGGVLAHLDAEDLKHIEYGKMSPEQKALYAGDATTGGFFAAQEFVNQLIAYQILISPMRSICKVIQTSAETVVYPNLLNDTNAFWAVEQQNFQTSNDPTLGILKVPVHEARGLVQISQQNLEDSVFNLEDFLKQRLAKKFAQLEGTAFVRGNGNGKPRGILTYNTTEGAYNATATPTGKQTQLTYIPYVPSGNASTLGQGDCLINALHDLKQYYWNNARWIFTIATLGGLRLIKDSQNRPLWEPFAATDLPGTIYGRPYTLVPDMDEIGTNNFPIVLGDFSEGYLIADRVGLNMRQLDELYAVQGLVGFIARMRVGGDVLLPEAFRKIKCSVS